MTSFKTLRELINYVPNCIVCGKTMQLSLEGVPVSKIDDVLHKYISGSFVKVKLELKESLQSFGKDIKHKVIVEPDTNLIIEGKEIINRMIARSLSVMKRCNTCDFKIVTNHATSSPNYKQIKWSNVKQVDNFPNLHLRSETLNYTFKKGRPVSISKYYYEDTQRPFTTTVKISIDNKILESVQFDFSKFKDREHLNNRLSTIMTFQ